jgi:signal peptidase I
MNLRIPRSFSPKELDKLYNPSLKDSVNKYLRYFIVVFIVIATTYGILKFTVTEKFLISGTSMFPAIKDNQEITINKFPFNLIRPIRGDIVVLYDGEDYITKRIIALPNEQIEINNKIVLIFNHQYPNGIPLEEKYIAQDANLVPYPTCKVPDCSQEYDKTTLNNNQYYALGDNRIDSRDSRTLGVIDRSLIIGVVLGQPKVDYNISSY